MGRHRIGRRAWADTGEETNRGQAAIQESQAMWDAFGAFLDK
jgi:hypothetical protein